MVLPKTDAKTSAKRDYHKTSGKTRGEAKPKPAVQSSSLQQFGFTKKPCESAAVETPRSKTTTPAESSSATPSATPHVEASAPAAQWSFDCKVRCPNPGCHQSTVGIPSKQRKEISTTTPFGKWLIKETKQFSIGSDQWCCTSCYLRMGRTFKALPKHAASPASAAAAQPQPSPAPAPTPSTSRAPPKLFANLKAGGSQERAIKKGALQAIDGVLKTYYPSDSTGLFASLLQDKRVQTAIPSDTKLSEIVANLKTAINSATDPSVRRAYLSVAADVNGTTIQQVMQDYNCTEHEAKAARQGLLAAEAVPDWIVRNVPRLWA